MSGRGFEPRGRHLGPAIHRPSKRLSRFPTSLWITPALRREPIPIDIDFSRHDRIELRWHLRVMLARDAGVDFLRWPTLLLQSRCNSTDENVQAIQTVVGFDAFAVKPRSRPLRHVRTACEGAE